MAEESQAVVSIKFERTFVTVCDFVEHLPLATANDHAIGTSYSQPFCIRCDVD
jgi:hypothetical protein